MNKVSDQYRKMIEQTHKDGESIVNNAMKPIYEQQKAALDDLHNYIGKLFIKYGKDGLLQLTDMQKRNIKQQISQKLKSMAKELGQNEIKAVTSALGESYKDCYYKQAYVLSSGGDNNG